MKTLLMLPLSSLLMISAGALAQGNTDGRPQNVERPSELDVNTTTPLGERASNADRSANSPARYCADCAPLKRYDDIEVVKSSHDVDQPRVINTEAVVQVRPSLKETNKLIIHENETRNVGVIQHNHRIVEKETRYVKRAPVRQRAAPAYQVPRVQTVFVSVVMQPVRNCGCPCTCFGSHGAYAASYIYGGGHAVGSGRRYVQQVLVPVNLPAGHGYR